PDGPSGPVFTWRAVDLPATLNPPIAGDHDDHSFPPIPDPARMAGLRPIPLAEPLATPAARRPARRAGRLASAAARRLGQCPASLHRRATWPGNTHCPQPGLHYRSPLGCPGDTGPARQGTGRAA